MSSWQFKSRMVIKCDRKVNITATFGSELVLEGNTAIPNVLLKIYKHIGITDFQMMLIVQMIRLSVEEKVYLPEPDLLAVYMESDPAKIRSEIESILKKEIIAVSHYYDGNNDNIFEGYDFEPLFLKLSDAWAGIRAREIEESDKKLRTARDSGKTTGQVLNNRIFDLVVLFEKEFGRPLSPIEVEQIEHWVTEMEELIILEALKRAVLMGKHNFKYINSILMEWKKNNIRTIESIQQYEMDFKKRRSKQGTNGTQKGSSQDQPGGKNRSKKKAFIRTLYV